MNVQLGEIAKSLLSAVESLQPGDRVILEQAVAEGNTLVEGLSYLLREECPELQEILEPVVDEVFVDLHVAVTLAMARQFKAACVLLRTCVEIGLYLVYFVDHPLEARIWSNNSQDLKFSDILAQVANRKYLSAASGREADDNGIKAILRTLQGAYRDLSERVHGKYAFLQSTATELERSPKSFASIASNSIRALISLIVLRCSDVAAIETKVPAIRRIV
jgi:hypothetical protein